LSVLFRKSTFANLSATTRYWDVENSKMRKQADMRPRCLKLHDEAIS
jgi:hypothetical protein